MRPDSMPGGGHLLEDTGLVGRVQADREKIALVQCAASAASTACVFFGQGPSSKVSTTSPSRRKSWVLKCSKPKPGPPVVSISTTRLIPRAFGLPSHEGTAATGG